jgi:hypothetical protein
MLLCQAHHTLCHEGGFTIGKDYQDRWFFRRPDGRAVPPSGYRLADMTDDDVWTGAEYVDGRPSVEGFAHDHVHPSAEGFRADNSRGCREDFAEYRRCPVFDRHQWRGESVEWSQ